MNSILRITAWTIALASLGVAAFAASVAVEGPTVLQKGTSNVMTLPAPGKDACFKEVEKLPAGSKRYCRTEYNTKALPVVVPPVIPPVVTWTRAAAEDTTFTLYAPAQVRYGAGSTWTSPRNFPAGPVACTNAVFTDPIEGTLKECQVSPASALTAPPAVGTAALTWTAPTQNTDGTPLTNLAGYRVYHGLSASALNDVIPVTGTSYNFTALASGTHYFAVSAYSTAGVGSALSAVGSKVIP
jgi:hypothetical protein